MSEAKEIELNICFNNNAGVVTEGISMDPAVCHGKPVIAGTRVLVSTILEALAGGDLREKVQTAL